MEVPFRFVLTSVDVCAKVEIDKSPRNTTEFSPFCTRKRRSQPSAEQTHIYVDIATVLTSVDDCAKVEIDKCPRGTCPRCHYFTREKEEEDHSCQLRILGAVESAFYRAFCS